MATFGNINTGTNNVNAPPSNDKAVSKFVLDRPGTIDHLLFAFNAGATQNIKAVVYDDTGVGGLPGALLATSAQLTSTISGINAFAFSSPPTLTAGNYWIGLVADTANTASCQALTNGIAFNSGPSVGAPSNPFGASPSTANFQYPEIMFYTPVLPAGTAYGQLLGGDAFSHSYVANEVIVLQITIPVAGSIGKLTTFIRDSFPSAKCKGVIYDNTGPSGGPGTLLGTTAELVGPVINGNDLIFPSPISVSAGTYYIGLLSDTTLPVCHLNDSTPNATGNATYTSGVPGTFPSAILSTGSWPLWATFTPPFNSTPVAGGHGGRSVDIAQTGTLTAAIAQVGDVQQTATPPASNAGSATGTGTATAVGGSIRAATGAAAGTGTASSHSIVTRSAVGSSTGTGTASAVGRAIRQGVGLAAGTGTAAAITFAQGAGTAAGTGTAAAHGNAIARAAGSSTGTGTASAVGRALKRAAGHAPGTSTANANVAVLHRGVGVAAGIGRAAAIAKIIEPTVFFRSVF